MAIAADTPVPTLDGWKRACDLTSDDIVFDPGGCAQPVGTVQAWIPTACYEVHFDDGLAVVGDRHLAFQLQSYRWRDHYSKWKRNEGTKFHKRFRSSLTKRTAAQLYKGPLTRQNGKSEYSLAVAGPLQYRYMDLPVPPYILGLWLGTRTQTNKSWVCKGMDINKMRAKARGSGFAIATRKAQSGRLLMEFRPSIAHSFMLFNQMAPDKIPFSYLFSSVSQRQELLDGLIDAQDAKRNAENNCLTISDPSWISVRSKQALIESLGMKTILNTPLKSKSYKLIFRPNPENVKHTRRFVEKVTQVEPKQCIHIATEAPFLVGEGFLAVC